MPPEHAGTTHQPPSQHVGIHRDPERWLPRLLRLLDEQTDLYNQLDQLGNHQTQHINNGDTNALLNTLARRQALITKIAQLNQDAEPFAGDRPALLQSLPEHQREQLRSRIETLDTLVARIAQRDEHDRSTLEQRRNTVSDELKNVPNQRSARNAYAPQAARANTAPRYQDRQG